MPLFLQQAFLSFSSTCKTFYVIRCTYNKVYINIKYKKTSVRKLRHYFRNIRTSKTSCHESIKVLYLLHHYANPVFVVRADQNFRGSFLLEGIH